MRLFFLCLLAIVALPVTAFADTDFIGRNKGKDVRRFEQVTNDLLGQQNKLMAQQNERLKDIAEALNEQAESLNLLSQNQQQVAVIMQAVSRQLVSLNDKPGIQGSESGAQQFNQYEAGAQALQATRQNEAMLRVLSQISEQQRLQSVLLETLLNQATGEPIVINE